jgi:hypothetical protein
MRIRDPEDNSFDLRVGKDGRHLKTIRGWRRENTRKLGLRNQNIVGSCDVSHGLQT